MLITKSEAARRLNITKGAVQFWEKENPLPGFFVKKNNRFFIDDEHAEFILRNQKMKATEYSREKHNKKIGEAVKKKRQEYLKLKKKI